MFVSSLTDVTVTPDRQQGQLTWTQWKPPGDRRSVVEMESHRFLSSDHSLHTTTVKKYIINCDSEKNVVSNFLW